MTDLLTPFESCKPKRSWSGKPLTHSQFVLTAGRFSITPAGCWEWNGHTTKEGYGTCRRIINGEKFGVAHRAFYTILVGPIPEGKHLDHLCRNRKCVNPEHLEPVTQKENVQRSLDRHRNVIKTHCIRGHAFTGYNVMYENGRDGSVKRRCRTCSVANKKGARAERRLQNASV